MSEYYENYIRYKYGRDKKRFNIIGFDRISSSNYSYENYRHCPYHLGTRLLKDQQEPDMLFCPLCGCRYPIKDMVVDQNLQTDITPASKTKIITGKKRKRKFYDKFGNEINDETLIQDIMQGKTVISYHEQKQGEDKPAVVKK